MTNAWRLLLWNWRQARCRLIQRCWTRGTPVACPCKKIMRILIIPLILFLGACGAREHRREATAASAPVSVQVQPATVVEWPVTYEAVGTVRARTAAVISAQVMGHVQEV